MSRVNLVGTWAPLLGGRRPQDCADPLAESCTGGVASTAAYLRNYSNGEPSLVVPRLDRYTPFVQMHPLGWNVNRLVLNDLMGWKIFVSTPSLLSQNEEISPRDLSILQTEDMPLLLTNAAVPPSNLWYPYTKAVYFDQDTGLAILSIADSDQALNIPQIDSTLSVLDYVAKVNMESGCSDATSAYLAYLNRTVDSSERKCWVPVVSYGDVKDRFDTFLAAVIEHEKAPALIIDIEGHKPAFSTPQRIGSKGVWLVSYKVDTNTYFQHRLSLSDDGRSVTNVELTTRDLEALPPELKDEKFVSDVDYLRSLSDEASANDPIVGNSTAMPIARDGDYRRCKAGECEIGNLFTDALRWFDASDVAFISSGGLRGLGWPAGPVKVSNIWESLPYPNLLCSGSISGVSLFKLFNYSVATATFQGAETSLGGKLLQVSGMRVTYNTQLEGSRLVALDIWNQTQGKYIPVERLRIYRFAADSYLCGVSNPYPLLTGGGFTIDGEVPGLIGDDLHQDIVRRYLSSLPGPYNASIQGRLVNETNVLEAMNLVQTKGDCREGTYWITSKQTCLECPDASAVAFSSEQVELEAVSGSAEGTAGKIQLVNGEAFEVSISLDRSPSWVSFTGASSNSTASLDFLENGRSRILQPGETLHLDFLVNSTKLETGTALGTVAFGVSGEVSYPGCVGQGADFDIFMRVMPGVELNQLDSIRAVGFSFAAIAVLTALLFAAWVGRHREERIIKTLQPIFLVTICFGVAIMAMTLIPLSIDDGIASERGCDIACMATPWLISIGFTVTFSALFSKLWRINKLFDNRHCRRFKVKEKDVLLPFVVVFTLNFVVLLSWTLVDPVRWIRRTMDSEKWNTYGSCKGSDTASKIFVGMAALVNVSALAITCWQAYKARNISDEFSESKNLGMALFSWVQLLIVGVPVLFLIDRDDVSARYFLQTALLFAMCMSMLLFIFVPMFIQLRKYKQRDNSRFVWEGSMLSGPSHPPVGRGSIVISGMNDSSWMKVDAPCEEAVGEEDGGRRDTGKATKESESYPTFPQEHMYEMSESPSGETEQTNSSLLKVEKQDEENPLPVSAGSSSCSSVNSNEDRQCNHSSGPQ